MEAGTVRAIREVATSGGRGGCKAEGSIFAELAADEAGDVTGYETENDWVQGAYQGGCGRGYGVLAKGYR